MAKWNSKSNPGLVSKKLDSIRTINQKGNASFDAFAMDELRLLVSKFIQFKADIPEQDQQRIVTKAIYSAGKLPEINAKMLIKEICKEERNYLALPVKRIKLDNALITFNPKMYGKPQKARQEVIELAKNNVCWKSNTNYIPVSVGVKARTEAVAFETAMEKIDLIRGVWNFWKNRQKILSRSFGKKEPVNKILLGPLHSMHKPNGELYSKLWWFETDFHGVERAFDDTRNRDRMLSFAISFRKRLKKLPYKEEIESAVIRYVRSLDSVDMNDSILRLWGVLEFLTGTARKRSEATINRTLFFSSDKEFDRIKLNTIKDYRNKTAHVGININVYDELVLYQLKYYVERVLFFHIANNFKFSSLKEATDFLDHPTCKTTLEKMAKDLKNVMKFITS